MSFELPNFLPGVFTANVDLSSAQYLPVKAVAASGADVSGPAIDKIGTSGEAMIGILQNNPLLAEAASVMVSGISKAVLRGSISVGQKLMAVPTGVGLCGSSKYAVGIALEDGVDGNVISMLIQNNGLAA